MIASGRHPFEVAVLIASVLGGIALMASGTRPASVAAAMPVTIQALWRAGLVVAGIVALSGVTWRGRLSTAMGVEMTGLTVLGTVTAMYGTALFVVSGTAAIAAGAFVVAVAVAAWARVWQIARDLRRIARAAEAGLTRDVRLLVERDR